MRIRWGRAIVATLAAETAGIAVLAGLVAIFGPAGIEAAQPFAVRLGQWVGPISGFVFCIVGGWWTAKPARLADRPRNGLAMGAAAAALDLLLGAFLASGFFWLLVVSNLGRLFGGGMGGVIAARRS